MVATVVEERALKDIRERILVPVIRELARRNVVYRGVLYAGLMITERGPRVLEFNCRFGDPETQAILPRWQGDILAALEACLDGTLSDGMVQWSQSHCVCVVLASGGYPGPYAKGKEIRGLDAAGQMADVMIFHAGTRVEGTKVVTAGGRVVGVTALGRTLPAAVDRAYEAVRRISFEGMFYRRDIAYRALNGAGR